MARSVGTFVENQFIQGLITEATGLNFPEKAVTESYNTRYNKKGNVTRRLGINHEAAITDVDGTTDGPVAKTFLWKGIGTEGRRTFLTIQSGDKLYFFEADTDGLYSLGYTGLSVDISAYATGLANEQIENKECAFASGFGRLYVAHPLCNPFYIEYDDENDALIETEIEIQIRDFEGIEETGIPIDLRPLSLTNDHKYNLWNQGWWERAIAWGQDEQDFPITWFLQIGSYPSNCDVWWYYKSVNSDGVETNNRRMINTIDLGNTLAPKGHYIYNAFDINRSNATGIDDLLTTSSGGQRPSAIAFFAGRVWYGGVAAPKFGNNIYYSQIIERDDQIGKCYQSQDPTAEVSNQLLDTDGGMLRIPEMGTCTGFFVSKSMLVIFATNGVWSIAGSGADGTGFVASDYTVSRLANVTCPSMTSLVDVQGSPFWWNYDGIYTLQATPTGGLNVVNISNDTIRSFIKDEIPNANRIFTQGAFNPIDRIVQWLWRSTIATNTTEYYSYDRILELNLDTGAFYPHSYDDTDQRISSIFVSENGGSGISYAGVNVYTITDEQVFISGSTGLDAPAVTITSDLTSGLLYKGFSGVSGSQSPSPYKSTGAHQTVVGLDGELYGVTSVHGGNKVTIFKIDPTTDTVTEEMNFTNDDIFTLASAYGFRMDNETSTVTAVLDFARVEAACLDPHNYILFVASSVSIHGDFVYFILTQINAAGALEIVGGGRYQADLGTNVSPNLWRDISVGLTKLDTDPIYAWATYNIMTNAAPHLFVFPPIATMLGANLHYNKTIGNYNHKHFTNLFDSDHFGNHSSYREMAGMFFCVPTGSSTLAYFYVGPSDMKAHLDNAGSYSANQANFVENLKAAYPDGIMGKIDLNGIVFKTASTNVWPTSYQIGNGDFVDAEGNSAFPFNFTKLYADGATENSNCYNDWNPHPTVVQITDGATPFYLVGFSQLLQNNSVDQMAGTDYDSFGRMKLFIWNGINQFREVANFNFVPFALSEFNVTDVATKYIPRSVNMVFIPGDPVEITGGKLYIQGDVGNQTVTNVRRFFWSKVADIDIAAVNDDPVLIELATESPPGQTRFKYVGMDAALDTIQFLEEVDTRYIDFASILLGGYDYESYFISGAKVHGEGHKSGVVEYITIFANTSDEASAKVRVRWDWANNSDSNKWSSEQEVYTVNRSNRDVSRKRLLIRGSGPALQLQFRSVSGKPFDLIGWSTIESVDGSP